MARLIPSGSWDKDDNNEAPQIVQIDNEAADEIFQALSSRTTRDILASLYQEPQTASELAEGADTTLQNVKYHLDKLEDAELAKPVGTVYSENAQEMTVYGPASGPLVVTAGKNKIVPSLRSALKYLTGGFGLLAILSLLINWVLSFNLSQDPEVSPIHTRTDFPGTVSGPITRTVAASDTPVPSPTPSEPLSTLPPGIVFFAGGAFVFLLLILWYGIQK